MRWDWRDECRILGSRCASRCAVVHACDEATSGSCNDDHPHRLVELRAIAHVQQVLARTGAHRVEPLFVAEGDDRDAWLADHNIEPLVAPLHDIHRRRCSLIRTRPGINAGAADTISRALPVPRMQYEALEATATL